MPPKRDPAREQLAEYYRTALEQGKTISLRRLADMSVDIVGKPLSYDDVKYWSQEDGWTKFVATSLGESPALRDKKTLFDKAKTSLFDTEEGWKEISGSARSLVALARSIPEAYNLLIEADLSEAHDYITSLLLSDWDDIPSTHRTTLVTVMGQLDKMMDQDVYVSTDGVSPDAALLKERER